MDAEWMGVGWYCPDDGSEEHTGRTKWTPCLDGQPPGAKYFAEYQQFKKYKQQLKLADRLNRPQFINGFNKKRKRRRKQ